MSRDDVDSSAHPMYYTEAYHRALVDKDIYGMTTGLAGAAAGGLVANHYAGKAIKTAAAEGMVEIGKHTKFARGGAIAAGALVVGSVAAGIGGMVGYVHGIASGPRKQQMNGWTGRIENERAQNVVVNTTPAR